MSYLSFAKFIKSLDAVKCDFKESFSTLVPRSHNSPDSAKRLRRLIEKVRQGGAFAIIFDMDQP